MIDWREEPIAGAARCTRAARSSTFDGREADPLNRYRFVERAGRRILRVDFTGLSPEQHIRELGPVRAFVVTQPPGSLLMVTFANDRFTAASADAIKEYVLGIDRHVRANAVVCAPGFRSAFIALLDALVRHEVRCFEQESDAIAWLVGLPAPPGATSA